LANRERVLDLGCGDGALTLTLARLGCDVVGVDSSPEQVAAAQRLGLDARVSSGERLEFSSDFDAVFSNAALRMNRADEVIGGVNTALRPGGRFVGELGGHGCVHIIRSALVGGLQRRGVDGESCVPWYFPTPGDYAASLERGGFRVDSIALIPRPTPLPGDVVGWLETFGENFMNALSPGARDAYLQEVRSALEPQLRDATGTWIADYVRLRFRTTKMKPAGV
jgi:SAM-dependent methyltransferase